MTALLKASKLRIFFLVTSSLLCCVTVSQLAADECSIPNGLFKERDVNELIYSDIFDLKQDYCEAVVWGEIAQEEVLKGNYFPNYKAIVFRCPRYARTIKNVLRKEHSVDVDPSECADELATAREIFASEVGVTEKLASSPTTSPKAKDIYQEAVKLLRKRKFPEASERFQSIVVSYPTDIYAAVSFFWLGELFLLAEDSASAIEHFLKMINLFPEHQKVPDALYKLGRIYIDQEDTDLGKAYLVEVIEKYPETEAAELSRSLVEKH